MSAVLAFEWVLMMVIAGLAGRWRGLLSGGIVGACCAAFWIVLCRAVCCEASGLDDRSIVWLAAGTATILGIAGWSGRRFERPKGLAVAGPRRAAVLSPAHSPSDVRRLGECLRRFDDWLERYRHDADPWPEFEEFLRGLLHELCGAARVKPYRMLAEGDVLVPLRAADPANTHGILMVPEDVVGFVLRTGRSWLAADPACRAEVPDSTATGQGPIAWSFPVRQAGRTIGAVTVGELPPAATDCPPFRDRLDTLEVLVSLCWTMLLEVCRSRASATTDPTSGVMTLGAFNEAGEHMVNEACRRGEPLAVLLIAVEGLRTLEEGGQWTQSAAVISHAGHLLALRCRSSDLLARFDESRFLMLLRRVDLDLASLIAGELLHNLSAAMADIPMGRSIRFRGGIAMNGSARPSLADLISQAAERCHQARRQGLLLLGPGMEAEAAG